jgi:hypothetical protein
MGLAHSPSVITDGLVFSVDAANTRSYGGSGITINGLVGGIGGTLIGGVGFSTSNNNSFYFDGSDDYVNLGNPAAIGITNNITIMVYFRYIAFTKNWQAILAKGDDSFRIHRYSATNQISFGMNFSGGLDTPSTSNFNPNQWYFVTATYSLPDVKLYINGVLDKTNTYNTPISSSSYNFYIGENAQAPGRNFYGNISHVSIYNRALSATEIKQNFEATRDRYGI